MAAQNPEPIDVVYTWVDGSDPVWQERKRARLAGLGDEGARLHPSAVSAARYRSRDELRFSLRSLERYAPFVRRVYLVTDHQVPHWLDVEREDLVLVSHEDLFPDPSHLPTFNSRAIECHLHRIPGLSERFLYFNDDVLLARPTTAADFFDDRGRCRVYLDRRRVVWDASNRSYDLPVNTAARTGSRLLETAFGYRIATRLDHVPYALRRSLLEEVWERFPDALEALSAQPFRHPDSVSLTFSLAPHYALCTGAAVAVSEPHSTYFKVKKKSRSSLKLAARIVRHVALTSGRRKFVSFNDAGELDDGWLTNAAIALFLRAAQPRRSRFERRSPRRAGPEPTVLASSRS
jgi:hypothetical protein